MEVRRLLPTMLRALRGLDSSEVDEAVLVEAPGMATEIDEVLSKHHQDPRIVRVSGSERRRRLASCGLAWTASGTATLECTLLGVPMIVGYRLHPATALVARTLVRIRQVALANLIAGRALVPQLLQQRWCPKQLIDETRRLNRSRREEQRKGLAEVRRLLGEPGASRRAAEAVLEHVARAPR